MEHHRKINFQKIFELGNWKKISLNDPVELLEEEKQRIDEKLQSVEKENSAGQE